VELANGTLAVHSTAGKGTTITATLPLDVITLRELAPTEQPEGASSPAARRAT
jgi:chemotaxis protein histidine kinase CheA